MASPVKMQDYEGSFYVVCLEDAVAESAKLRGV